MTIYFVERSAGIIIAAYATDQGGTLTEQLDDTVDAELITYLAAQTASQTPPTPAVMPFVPAGTTPVGDPMFGLVRAADLGGGSFMDRETLQGWYPQVTSVDTTITPNQNKLLLICQGACATVTLPMPEDCQPFFSTKIRSGAKTLRIVAQVPPTGGIVIFNNGFSNYNEIILPPNSEAECNLMADPGLAIYGWSIESGTRQVRRMTSSISYLNDAGNNTVSELTMSISPTRSYRFRVSLHFNPIGAVGGSRVRMSATTTPADLSYNVLCRDMSAVPPVNRYGAMITANNTVANGATGTQHSIDVEGIIKADATAASQQLRVQCGQSVSNGTASVLAQGIAEMEEIYP